MPALHLTDLVIRNLRAEAQTTFWDTQLKGFGVRVGKSRKTWTVMKGKKRERITIGHYPDLSLSEARRKAMLVLGSNTPTQTSILLFRDVFDSYFDLHVSRALKPTSIAAIGRIFRCHWLPPFGKRGLSSITAGDIRSVLDGLLETPAEANQTYKFLSAFLRWCVSRQLIDQTPCDRIKKPAKLTPRSRVLDETEIKTVWGVCDRLGQYGTIVRILILTGARKNEIATLQWSSIGHNSITLSDTKNSRPHTFPIGKMVINLLLDNPRRSGTNYVFPGQSVPLYIDWVYYKRRMDKLSGVTGWTLHDLRRTFATKLAELGVRIEVTERLLNHISGSFGGIVGVYQKHTYLPEMRLAVEKWEERLTQILAS